MEAESDWVDFENVFEKYNDGPPFTFKAEFITHCYKKKTSQANVAVQLVKRSYSKAERSASNCSGTRKESYPQIEWKQ